MVNYQVTYSQNREDLILAGFFDDEEIGFYVDVGANEPVHESVTKYFYDKGWSGINVEPIPSVYDKLVKARKRDINIQAGIGLKKSKAILHYYPNGDGLSTISDKMATSYLKTPTVFTQKAEELTIDILPLRDVLKRYKKTNLINFMKIDVEGFEYDVIASNDWDLYRPQVICVEANHVDRDWKSILTSNSYELVFFDGLNEYYTDKHTDRKAKFDYVKAIIFKEPIVNFRLLKNFDKYEERIRFLEDSNNRLEIELRKILAAYKNVATIGRHIRSSAVHHLKRLDKGLTTVLRGGNFKPTKVDFNDGDISDLIETAKTADHINIKRYRSIYTNSYRIALYEKSKHLLIMTVKKFSRMAKR